MKNTFSFVKLTALTALAAIGWTVWTLHGCSSLGGDDCNPPPDTDIYMTAADSAAVPYRGGEVLRYQRSVDGVVQDTLVFESISSGEDMEWGSSCIDDCGSSFAILHHPEWVYRTADGMNELRIPLDLFAFECTGGLPDQRPSVLGFIINNERFGGIAPAQFEVNDGDYYPDTVVNGKQYADVWDSTPLAFKILYSKEFGFLVAEVESTEYSLIR